MTVHVLHVILQKKYSNIIQTITSSSMPAQKFEYHSEAVEFSIGAITVLKHTYTQIQFTQIIKPPRRLECSKKAQREF